MSVGAALGSRFNPLDEDYLVDPYPFLAEARESASVFYCEALDHWAVTRYDDVRTVFLRPDAFSAANANSPLAPVCPQATAVLAGYGAVPTLANVDPPDHTRVRRMVNSAFTPRRIAAMEPLVRQVVTEFCDERLRLGHADIVRDFAWDLPAVVLFSILGTPTEDVARVKEGSWSRILLIYGKPSEDLQIKAAEGLCGFWQYARELVEDRVRHPRNDFTSDLAAARDEHGKGLTVDQAATVALNLLFAGHETTTGLLGNAFRRLLDDQRAAWKEICADPGLIPGAIEEVLRLDSSVVAWRRRTSKPVTLAGVDLPANANVLLLLGSANRDPAKFSNPDTFDIHRPNAHHHLSLGHGPHFCLGGPRARLEARIALEEVSARLPGLRLAPDASPEFSPNVSFRSPLSLPVQWR